MYSLSIVTAWHIDYHPPMLLTDARPDMERELRFFPAPTESPRRFTRDQISEFNDKGFVFPLDIFSDEEAGANRLYFDGIMEKAAAAGHNSYSINGWHRYCTDIYDLVMEPRILDYVEDLLGPDLICTMTHYFCKLPGETKQVAWHQDASYWPLTPSKVVTVWLAVDDVDDENGPMTVIPGSHQHGQIPFAEVDDREVNVLGQSVPNPLDWGNEPVPFTMKAGQISLHSDLLLHGSVPNRSNRRRCGLTLRYNPPDVRGQDPDCGSAIIARGGDESGYWQHIERPPGDMIPAPR
jgi:non-heme Fe2+,alpha-ketoglutarate-dependent halogenase